MNIFNKLFGKDKARKTSQQIEKTSELLDENIYWSIIENSLKNHANQNQQEKILVKQIEKLTLKEIIGFRLTTDKLLYDTYTSEMWCAGYIMNGGCSDDSFEYFRNWIISRGEKTYYEAKSNPDTLISEYIQGQQYYDYEEFWYVALTAFENRTGKLLYDYIADDFETREGKYPEIKFNWQDDQPDTMKKICPKLFEKVWN